MGKNLSAKYGQKLLNSAKKATADSKKTASKRAIHKTAEATVDLVAKLLIKQQMHQKNLYHSRKIMMLLAK